MARLNVPAIASAAVSVVSVPLAAMAAFLETQPHAHEPTALAGLCVVSVAALGMVGTALGGAFVARMELQRSKPRLTWRRNPKPLYPRFHAARLNDDLRAFRALNKGN